MVTSLIVMIILKCMEISNHYAIGTNTELQANYTSKKKKNNNKETQEKKRLGLWLPKVGSEGQWDWMKAAERYTLPVITYTSTRDATYNTKM